MKLTRRSLLAGLMATALPWQSRAQGRDIAVLVTVEPDPDLSLASLEVRKLFLGFTIVHDGNVLQPVRNRSDEFLDQIFLQHIVSMSVDAYERRLLAQSIRQGRVRPREVRSREELVHVLTTVHHSISYAWQADIGGIPDIHVVRTLWRA